MRPLLASVLVGTAVGTAAASHLAGSYPGRDFLSWPAALAERPRAVKGVEMPALRSVPALRGTAKRDYAYDQFWVTSPLRTREGTPLFSDADQQAEIIVRIHDKEGRAVWTIPPSIRERGRTASPR
jgi:hypothetical protein